MGLIHRVIQHLSLKTSDLFLELNSSDAQDEQFDEYFFNQRDLGKVLRELIRLLTVPKITPVLEVKLNEALEIARNNSDNVLSWVNVHGVLSAFEQVTRIIQIEDMHLIKTLLAAAWSLPYQDYVAFRLMTLDIIENLAYVVNEKTHIGSGGEQDQENNMVQETMEFVKYVVDSLSVKLAQKSAASSLKKLCTHGKEILSAYSGEIIQKVLPEQIVDWKNDQTN